MEKHPLRAAPSTLPTPGLSPGTLAVAAFLVVAHLAVALALLNAFGGWSL